MIIHAMHRWPEVVKQYLWPYAIHLATHIRNKQNINKQVTTPAEKLTELSQPFDVKNDHPFGCPTYALDASLQDVKSIPRWNERIRV